MYLSLQFMIHIIIPHSVNPCLYISQLPQKSLGIRVFGILSYQYLYMLISHKKYNIWQQGRLFGVKFSVVELMHTMHAGTHVGTHSHTHECIHT